MPWKPGQSGNPEKRFAPGVSGNPRGRPHKRPITRAYEQFLLSELPPEMLVNARGEQIHPMGTTFLDLVAQAAVMKAAMGDIRVARELRLAIEGCEALRIERFRDFIEDEAYDEAQQAVAELDEVDRNLIAAATSLTIDMIQGEYNELAVKRLAAGTGGTEAAAPESTPAPSGPDTSADQAS
jgi:Family of unknown function (DUF5681)